MTNRQIFQDSLLDLLHAIVILVQNLLRFLDIAVFPGKLLPGKLQKSLDVGAADRALLAAVRHRAQAVNLLADLVLHFLTGF